MRRMSLKTVEMMGIGMDRRRAKGEVDPEMKEKKSSEQHERVKQTKRKSNIIDITSFIIIEAMTRKLAASVIGIYKTYSFALMLAQIKDCRFDRTSLYKENKRRRRNL